MNPSIAELLSTKEELNPELKKHLTPMGSLGRAIKHPLLYEILYDERMNALINERFRYKKDGIKKALINKDYEYYIFLHERPYRLDAFTDVWQELSDEKYWEILRSIWTDSENIWQNLEMWKFFLSSTRPGSFMSDEDKKVYAALPEQLTIYRGYTPRKNRNGISYTLDRATSVWFSKRFSAHGKVLTLEVKKSSIKFYTNARSEQEVIYF